MLNINNYKKQPKILVVGDLMIDNYLSGSCEKISPEAPVPVVNIDKNLSVLGGAGNVLNNLKSLGASVDILSVIGDDVASYELISMLKSLNITSEFLVTEKNRKTSKKTRILAQKQQVIRYDNETTHDISTESANFIVKTFTKNIANYEIILLSDYGKGVFTANLTRALIDIGNKNNKKVLADPKGYDYTKYNKAYLLTPNKKELIIASNMQISDTESLTKAMLLIKNNCNLKLALTTLSEDGIAILSKDNKLIIYPTKTREVYDVTGAGDSVLAALGFALAIDDNIDNAIKFANLAAGIVVGKIGSASVNLAQINDYQANIYQNNANNIQTIKEIIATSKKLKQNSQKIVFTNGCFDLLHAGHIKYLQQASSYGDKLIVALNSDSSVSNLKGNNRPINNELDRACILASLKMVDFVVIFDEDTPYNLIKSIKPDVLVKGGDYKNKTIIGSNVAKKVAIVDFVANKSTSNIINKIKG